MQQTGPIRHALHPGTMENSLPLSTALISSDLFDEPFTCVWVLCARSSATPHAFRQSSQQCDVFFQLSIFSPGFLTKNPRRASNLKLENTHSACLSASNATTNSTVDPPRFGAHFNTYTDPKEPTAVGISRERKMGAPMAVGIPWEPGGPTALDILQEGESPTALVSLKEKELEVLGKRHSGMSHTQHDSKQYDGQNYESQTAWAERAAHDKHKKKPCIEQTPEIRQASTLWLGQSTVSFTKALLVRYSFISLLFHKQLDNATSKDHLPSKAQCLWPSHPYTSTPPPTPHRQHPAPATFCNQEFASLKTGVVSQSWHSQSWISIDRSYFRILARRSDGQCLKTCAIGIAVLGLYSLAGGSILCSSPDCLCI